MRKSRRSNEGEDFLWEASHVGCLFLTVVQIRPQLKWNSWESHAVAIQPVFQETPKADGESRVSHSSFVNTGHEDALQSYSEVVQLLLKQCATDDSIVHFDNEVQYLRLGNLMPTVHTQQVNYQTFTCGSVYNVKPSRVILADGIQGSVREKFRHW